MPRYSIQNKIVFPFILLFAAVLLVVPIITIVLFDQTYNQQFARETQRWLQVIKDTGYINQPEQVKQAYTVEVIVFGSNNGINFTTMDPLSAGDLVDLIPNLKLKEARRKISASNGELVSQNVIVNQKPYKAIYDPLKQGRLYCLLRPMDSIAEAKRQLTWLMLGIATIVISLVALISHFIGGHLTNPVKDLVQYTQQVAEGNLAGQANVKTRDEIGELTRAFNQMTRNLRNSRNELLRTERLATAGKMAASFAHEIRNPLSSMRMLAQMLLNNAHLPTLKHTQSISFMLEEIERIDLIVKGLLDFSRPSALEPALHDLNQTLEEVLNLMQANLDHHKITLMRNFDVDLPRIRFDRNKIKQVFMNIILNTMEAISEEGTVEIITSRESNHARVDVIDSGIGIATGDLEQLFEPFFTTKLQGTGLGLANAKRILEQHNGSIKIESTIEQGTKVSLLLLLR